MTLGARSLRASSTVTPGMLPPLPGPGRDAGLLRARPVALDRIRLTGGPLKRAQELTASYLLSLEPDRMMAFYRIRAGLEPKGKPYGGWDGPGRISPATSPATTSRRCR